MIQRHSSILVDRRALDLWSLLFPNRTLSLSLIIIQGSCPPWSSCPCMTLLIRGLLVSYLVKKYTSKSVWTELNEAQISTDVALSKNLMFFDVWNVYFIFFNLFLDSVERCKRYPNPTHGRVVCDSLFRLFCAPECDDGFVFESKPAVVYMCGPLTGEWFTYPEGQTIPWPNCRRRKR